MKKLFSNPPALAKYMFILLAAFLVALAFLSFGRITSDIGLALTYATYTFMMFIDAAIMLFFAFRIGSRKKPVYQFAMVFLVLNIILTIFDQVGMVDIVFILLNAFTLYVLYAYRDDFSESVG
jgi:lysylphosphatidylglycerol synthetase-like protein (DUF2156 family)